MTTVLTVGVFDLMHPGHVEMLRDCKSYGDRLIVGVQTSYGVSCRPEKRCPILNTQERMSLVSAVKYVNEIFIYDTETDLMHWFMAHFNEFDIRVIGSDHKDKPFTGDNIPGMMEKVRWHQRGHDWSTTSIIERVKERIRNGQC